MAGGNRPGRPGLGEANRPTTLPGTIGGTRPGGGGGPRPPQPGDLGGNRPGGGLGGGNRPGLGGNRPTTLPGDLGGNRPGSGNRPGIGGNRPVPPLGDLGHWNGGHRPGRPGIGGNRPGIGNGNSIWNNGNWNSGNFSNNHFNNVNVGGGWGYPGWGGNAGWNHGWNNGWNHGWNNGWVNPHYGGWYNGGWGNGWGYNGGWWAPFLTGAATWGLVSSIGSWGLGYGALGYGAAGYVNPYYAAMPAAVVASSPYDYSQPLIIDSSSPAGAPVVDQTAAAQQPAPASAPSDTFVDEALGTFKAGDYAAALAGFDKALKLSPNDTVIHEVRALALFALGRYTEAAAALNAVLATAPGMDWITMSNLYGSIDAYTGHLRTLEEFCRSHPDDAAAHFVLAYHYLVGGYPDMAAEALRVVVAKQPGDVVAKRLLEGIAPAAEQPAAAPAATPTAEQALPAGADKPEIDLVGTWKASSGKDTIELTVTADSAFTWQARPDGKPAVELKGTIETSADAMALVSESAGTMVAKVTPKSADSFEFALPAAPKDTPPLVFVRQP